MIRLRIEIIPDFERGPSIPRRRIREILLADIYEEAFARPAQRGREVPFDFNARRLWNHQREERQQVLKDLAELLTNTLFELAQEDDTIDGYSQAEYKDFHGEEELKRRLLRDR